MAKLSPISVPYLHPIFPYHSHIWVIYGPCFAISFPYFFFGKGTSGDLKSDDYVNKLIQLDEGFRVLRNLRGSPPYFEKCKKDLFVMIRQLGNPTWFCSFSAAETRWVHLLKTLGKACRKERLY